MTEIEIRSKISRNDASNKFEEVYYFRLKEFDEHNKLIVEKDFSSYAEVELWRSGAMKKYIHLRGLYDKI